MPRITIVEDDENIAELLKFMLSREGHDVCVFADGRAALDAIRSESAPNLVILDSMLPYVDGPTLLTAIRANGPWRTVPVVMLTARSLERDVVGALDAGANDYVVKPFQPQELLARVRRWLRKAA